MKYPSRELTLIKLKLDSINREPDPNGYDISLEGFTLTSVLSDVLGNIGRLIRTSWGGSFANYASEIDHYRRTRKARLQDMFNDKSFMDGEKLKNLTISVPERFSQKHYFSDMIEDLVFQDLYVKSDLELLNRNILGSKDPKDLEDSFNNFLKYSPGMKVNSSESNLKMKSFSDQYMKEFLQTYFGDRTTEKKRSFSEAYRSAYDVEKHMEYTSKYFSSQYESAKKNKDLLDEIAKNLENKTQHFMQDESNLKSLKEASKSFYEFASFLDRYGAYIDRLQTAEHGLFLILKDMMAAYKET